MVEGHTKGKTKENYEPLMKISLALKQKYRDDPNIKCGFKKGRTVTKEQRKKISDFQKGRKKSKEEIENIRQGSLKSWKNPIHRQHHIFDEKTIEKLRTKAKKSWSNPKQREKQLKAIFKGLKLRPTKPEKVMINLIEENNLPFNYVGDGKVILNGFCPDFLSKNPKKIIEIFGNYWHTRKDSEKRDKRRLKSFSKLGYETLVIWESELQNTSQVLNKIRRFM